MCAFSRDKRYDYDAHGNLTEKLTGKHTRLRLEWNAAHQLVKSVVTRNAQEPNPTVQTVKYAYDPFGRRIIKRDSFGLTRFVWEGNRLLCEARSKWERTYVYEPDSFVPLAQLDSVAGDGDDERRSEVHHIHTDHLGTPNEVTDQQGQIVWASLYKAWGNVLRVVEAAPKRHSLAAVDSEAANDVADFQPIRFLGQYHDTETGLNYNRFRYYDSDCGRYVSLDPIGLVGGNNSYQYAPNPSGWTDPLGLTKTCPCTDADNAATDKIVTIGNAKRAKIVSALGDHLQPVFDKILALDPKALIGLRGSLASGLKGPHKLDANMNRIGFDGTPAYKLNPDTKKYESYNEKGYDGDYFVVSDKLAANPIFTNPRFRNLTTLDKTMAKPFAVAKNNMMEDPVLSGMKNERLGFIIRTTAENNKLLAKSDAQYYFIK